MKKIGGIEIMIKIAMMEIIDRLIISGLSEENASLLVAAFITEIENEKKENDLLDESIKDYFGKKPYKINS